MGEGLSKRKENCFRYAESSPPRSLSPSLLSLQETRASNSEKGKREGGVRGKKKT